MPPKTPIQIVIDGTRIDGIAGFYDEINRVFMSDEDWTLGHSLDGLDDMLHGGYGAAGGTGAVVIRWRDMDHSSRALGRDATRAWLLSKRDAGQRFNQTLVQSQLDALKRGEGETFFQIVLGIFADHPRFQVIPS